jgi:hypothetical protein
MASLFLYEDGCMLCDSSSWGQRFWIGWAMFYMVYCLLLCFHYCHCPVSLKFCFHGVGVLLPLALRYKSFLAISVGFMNCYFDIALLCE